MNRLLGILLLVVIGGQIKAQQLYEPKLINETGSYRHKATRVTFPVAVHDYKRISIEAFDKKKENIAAKYECTGCMGKTVVSVYIYPAFTATERRLREEFLNSAYGVSLSMPAKVKDKYIPCFYERQGYKLNGCRATFDTDVDGATWLEVYECGGWFFKLRTTSDLLDSTEMAALNRKFVQFFNPTDLVRASPVGGRPQITVGRLALRDESFFACALGSSFYKLDWLQDNVDSLERLAGITDLYLGMNIAGINGFLKQSIKGMKTVEGVKKYIAELEAVKNAGFLNEFVMEEFDRVMIVPPNQAFDFAGYTKWRQSNRLTIDLRDRYYLLWYKPAM
jgi:hypothetical protein